jgi:hypothetical protein
MAKKTIEKPVQEFELLSNSALSMVGLYEDKDGLFDVIANEKIKLERGYCKQFGNRLFVETTEQELRDLLKAGKIKRV